MASAAPLRSTAPSVLLEPVLHLLESLPGFRRLVEETRRGVCRSCAGVLRSARAPVLAALHRHLGGPILWVSPSSDAAERLSDDLQCFLSPDNVMLFPEQEAATDGEASLEPARVEVLEALNEGRKPVVIAPVRAVLQPTMTAQALQEGKLVLRRGEACDLTTLLGLLQLAGYRRVPMVERRGELSVRGGILDVYPVTGEPVRLEMFGDEIESIRVFDRDTQRSVAHLDQVTVIQARPGEESSYLTDYLPEGAPACLEEPAQLKLHTLEWTQEQGSRPWDAFQRLVEPLSRIAFTTWEPEAGAADLPFRVQEVLPDRVEGLKRRLPGWREKGHRVILASRQASRLREILQEQGVPPASQPTPGSVLVLPVPLSEGFRLELPDGPLEVLTDCELVGARRRRRPSGRVDRGSLLRLEELQEGDLVVHHQHGIGRYCGVRTLDVQGVQRDFLQLRYAGGDNLYVPVEQLDLVGRYRGLDEEAPPLSRLGGTGWSRRRQRAKQAARDIARELLRLYARREMSQGHAYPPDSPWQREMEEAFPWRETSDQARAIAEVKRDLERPRPMDRLVCGDVGYGKTEVALRAAFKVIVEGRQVAVLVPTTVLAHQHYQTFSERLAPFPVRLELLSRFRSAREQRAVVEGLKTGEVDMVVGTHRLLSRDVEFRSLGLLVIDEEHRFGVRQKERLKELRTSVDVMTLSATPIPRTLHMAMSGIRDISVIDTPPEDRLPIKTYLFEYHPDIVKAAVTRELMREGQVYFVHNRVQGLQRLAQDLRRLVPSARVAVAHGQMEEAALEKVMMEFYEGRHDVLVCTTIIESGLDVPNANTILINNAHSFGLAQLYQLRGRVGRSASQAWCYLLYPPTRRLTEAAERRLETIKDFTQLGAGFQIALRDLEIRGAGDLLGTEQSGHIAAVGFDLYCQLLREAVQELRGEKREEEPPTTTVELPVGASLPDHYVPESRQKVALYKRIAGVKNPRQLEEVREELRDRYGPLPEEAQHLLELVELKLRALDLEIPALRVRDGRLVVLLPFYPELTPRQCARLEEVTGWKARYHQKSLTFQGLLGRGAGTTRYPPPGELITKTRAILDRLQRWRQDPPR